MVASPDDVIRRTVYEVCRDGNADSGTVTSAVLAVLRAAGYEVRQKDELVDIRAGDETRVELKLGKAAIGTVVWVNVDGVCRLRICNLTAGQITIEDERDFAELVEAGAKALAWSTLTDLGRQTGDWMRDFNETERIEFRAIATAVLRASDTR